MSSLGIFDKETKTYKKVADLSKPAVIDSAMSDTSTNAVQNKVVKSYVDTRTTVDTGMSDTSTNPVQNKAVKSYIDGRTALDTTMSDTSTKAVQNNVVKSYVDGRTTFDAAMSDTSTNAVQNKIVKSYVDTCTALDTAMSDTSTKAVQNKVVKGYVDGKFKQKLLAQMLGDGKTSYWQLCTIKINKGYIDTPIEITVQKEKGRATLDRLTVSFTGSNNSDPDLASFNVFGECSDWYISKRADSTWVIYGAKSDEWAYIRVVDYVGIDGVNVTWDLTGVTSLPDSKIKAVWGGNVNHAVSADSASSASTVNGHTVNSDVPSGAKFTDTNTWRGIQNNLTSDSTTDSLSAAQGKVLKGLVDGKASNSIYGDTHVSMGRESGTTVGTNSIAVGYNVTASGDYSHAEGDQTTASKMFSHAEGGHTTASEMYSHAEGGHTTASEMYSHAEGYQTTASGSNGSHAEGYQTTASGSNGSHAEGAYTTASGVSTHASGYHTTATNYASTAIGKYNKAMKVGSVTSKTGDAFVIGNGTFSEDLSNAMRVTYGGAVYGLSAFNASGADYAEFVYEWEDGNPDDEDRVGYFVTFKDKKICKAKSSDIIIGITSGNASMVGNADEDYYWKYERDEFGRIVWEDVEEVIEEGDPVTGEISYIKTGKIIPNGRMKISKDYDLSKQSTYVERKDRKEWDYVGMKGVLHTRDDGSCIPGEFCKCNDDGIATHASLEEFNMSKFSYVVLERINDHVIKVLL